MLAALPKLPEEANTLWALQPVAKALHNHLACLCIGLLHLHDRMQRPRISSPGIRSIMS